MSSLESSRDKTGKTAGRKEPRPRRDSEGEEPTNLVINIKEEPVDKEYFEECHNNGENSDEPSAHPQDSGGESAAESESEYYKEICLPQVVLAQESETPQTRVVISPCISPPVPNGGSVRSFKSGRDLSGVNPPATLTSTRLVPVNIKTSGPIPIALTLSKPAVDPKTNPPSLNSQAQAHHLMTLATEADKILQKQEKRMKGETRSGPCHDDEEKLSNSEEDNMCSSSDSSGGGMDAFLNSNDQTLTLIQRRAAEASISSARKTKRKRSQLPDDMKDDTYWERRRKNNEAAKRSRDARRAKEDQIAIRAALLEQENMRLRIEVAALKEETIRLKGMLYESQKR